MSPVSALACYLVSIVAALPLVLAHIAMFSTSMYGLDVTNGADPRWDYDNRPSIPLENLPFSKWWFHGHIDLPPPPGVFFELPAGQAATAELSCNKDVTSLNKNYKNEHGNHPCPLKAADGTYPFPNGAMHTSGLDELKGCALAIAYESDPHKIQPEDFAVFSINHTCVWTRFTDFQVPARMPPCPEEGCHCAWFWIHSHKNGTEQNYMNAFKCKVTGSTSNVPLGKPQVARRCGKDPESKKFEDSPGNCTYGPKQPFYWLQAERNNVFEWAHAPPYYTDLYNFRDGAQNDIFEDSYPDGLPPPSPDSNVVPTPLLGGASPSPSSPISNHPSTGTGTNPKNPTATKTPCTTKHTSIPTNASTPLDTGSAEESDPTSQPLTVVVTTIVVTLTVDQPPTGGDNTARNEPTPTGLAHNTPDAKSRSTP